MSTETVEDGTAVHVKENDEEKRLYLFGDGLSHNIFYAFQDYRPLSGSYGIVEGSIMQAARSDVWIATMLTGLEQSKNRSGHIWKVYADTWTSHVIEAVSQLIGQARRFEQI